MSQIITHGVTVAAFVREAVSYAHERGGDPAEALAEFKDVVTGNLEGDDTEDYDGEVDLSECEALQDSESDESRNLDAAIKVAAEFLTGRGGYVNLPDADIDKIFLAVQGIPVHAQSGVDKDTTTAELDEKDDEEAAAEPAAEAKG